MTRLKGDKDVPGSHPYDVRFGTPREIAEYRAERLAKYGSTIIEVGAGAGFQTQEFAKFFDTVIAIDIDEERLSRGDWPDNVTVIAGDALDPKIIAQVKESTKDPIIFLDPERPPSAKSRTLEEIKPDIKKFLEAYGEISKNICIEFPPFLDDIPGECEREFVSINGQLNRQHAYYGTLRECEISVMRLPHNIKLAHSGPIKEPKGCAKPQYIHDPDRALQRAGLVFQVLKGAPFDIGNREVVLTATEWSKWAMPYRIIASGRKENIIPHLKRAKDIIIHGKLPQKAQRELLWELNPHCTGEKRLHVFLGEKWYLAERLVGD